MASFESWKLGEHFELQACKPDPQSVTQFDPYIEGFVNEESSFQMTRADAWDLALFLIRHFGPKRMPNEVCPQCQDRAKTVYVKENGEKTCLRTDCDYDFKPENKNGEIK